MKTIPILLLLLSTITVNAYAQSSEVNLYSARKEALISPLLKAFTEQTGIKVNIISSKAEALLKRIQSEGLNSPADVLLTTDAGRLHRAKSAGVFKSIDSTVLDSRIPAHYRDSDNTWFGLSVRLRPIMVTGDSPITRYQDLSDPAYKGKICVRSSGNIYNQSLAASMIHHMGSAKAEAWAKGLVANFARRPQGGDRDQIRAAAVGQCNVVLANTYYLAQMLANHDKQDDYQAAQKIRVIWPNQNDTGAHANVSGAGVLKHAPNKANAIKLIEFLTSDTAQKIYANVNYEYPVVDGVERNEILASWGDFKADGLALNILGENNAQAVRLMDRAGWK